jgi:hypothetical protein
MSLVSHGFVPSLFCLKPLPLAAGSGNGFLPPNQTTELQEENQL